MYLTIFQKLSVYFLADVTGGCNIDTISAVHPTFSSHNDSSHILINRNRKGAINLFSVVN